mgnify:CR=1 FL=1
MALTTGMIAVDDEKPQAFNSVFESLLYAESVTLERDGVTKQLALPSNFIAQLLEKEERILFVPRFPTIIPKLKFKWKLLIKM